MISIITKNPTEISNYLIYADWLEEQGDFNAEIIRILVETEIKGLNNQIRLFQLINPLDIIFNIFSDNINPAVNIFLSNFKKTSKLLHTEVGNLLILTAIPDIDKDFYDKLVKQGLTILEKYVNK